MTPAREEFNPQSFNRFPKDKTRLPRSRGRLREEVIDRNGGGAGEVLERPGKVIFKEVEELDGNSAALQGNQVDHRGGGPNVVQVSRERDRRTIVPADPDEDANAGFGQNTG